MVAGCEGWKVSASPPKPKLTAIRWIFAIIGALVMVFAGGCSILYSGFLLFVAAGADGGKHALGALTFVVLIGGIPFLAGLGIWWLAVKAGR